MNPKSIDQEIKALRIREAKLKELKRLRDSVDMLEIDESFARNDNQKALVRILEVVSKYFNISPSLILSRNRTEWVYMPRFICYTLARELTAATFSGIGEFFGRDHGAVTHGLRRFRDRKETDHVVRADYLKLLHTARIALDAESKVLSMGGGLDGQNRSTGLQSAINGKIGGS